MALFRSETIRHPVFLTLVLGLSLMWFNPAQPAADASSLAAQLQQLARDDGFAISGLERLEAGAAAEQTQGTTIRRIKALLEGYDYAIVHQTTDRISRLIILGKKRAAPPAPEPSAEPSAAENVIPTRRDNGHHWITATLRGPSGDAVTTELMVDTGATLVALPSSKAGELGLDPEALETREMQTAKGKVQAKIGRLQSIELGNITLPDVQAAFVDDEQLGSNALLGMNVLGRYVFILDDERNELTLIPDEKPTGAEEEEEE
jgi:clan AA aspartic protease (TIGR02281 family)